MFDMTHSYVCHDSFTRVTRLIQMCDMTHSFMWHDSFKCVTWLIQMCDMTHSNVWHDSFICVTWLIQMCDMTHSYVWHGSSECVHVTHSNVWYDSNRIYGLATISRLLENIDLFCKTALWKRRYSAKETYNFKEPTNRRHPIVERGERRCCRQTDAFKCAAWLIQISCSWKWKTTR